MLNMDVEIISRESVKPSSPTPPQLRTFNLSFLDQLTPMYYVPIVFFYTIHDTNPPHFQQLKDSLSQALSIFYPLAGRVKDHLTIDCNDQGVLFSQAQISCHISDFLQQPQIELLDQFLPRLDMSVETVQLAIQINIFASGGIAIGVSFLHRIIDASTIKAFLGCWAAIACGSNHLKATICPDYNTAASLFPPTKSQEDLMLPFDISWLVNKGKGIWRRFVFDAAAILALKAKATSEAVPNPTRFESVAGFIWKCAMAASRALGSQQPSMMMVAVNMRPKMVPPISENSIGNVVGQAMAHHKGKGYELMELNSVVGILRAAVKKIDADYTLSLQGDEGVLTVRRSAEELRDRYSSEAQTPPDVYTCSSWCGFGFYDVDLGWGKPVWVALTGGVVSIPMFANSTIMIDTKSGDGIEAWVLSPENHMAKLQSDAEFLAFASLNPSIAAS